MEFFLPFLFPMCYGSKPVTDLQNQTEQHNSKYIKANNIKEIESNKDKG